MGMLKDLALTFGGIAAILAVGGGLYALFFHFTSDMIISIIGIIITFIIIYLAVQYRHIDYMIEKKMEEYSKKKKGVLSFLGFILVALVIFLIILFIVITRWGGIIWW